MATEEHKQLAGIIKAHHEDLRDRSKIIGAELAWKEHLINTEKLKEYSEAMSKLASIWEANTTREDLSAFSRVKWIVNYCYSYFYTERIYLEKREKEKRLLESWSQCDLNCRYLDEEEGELENIRLLDVGSCFNPFKDVPRIEVCAIDLCPSNEDVLKADFLQIKVSDSIGRNHDFLSNRRELTELPKDHFNCVVFSLLLEYIPSSEQRIECCLKAYDLLGPEGILIIVTPDSQNVGKNASIMKTWRYTLATFGFMRIKFEKLSHITCMVFRKSINPYLSKRWAELHHEDYMTVELKIPQDERHTQ